MMLAATSSANIQKKRGLNHRKRIQEGEMHSALVIWSVVGTVVIAWAVRHDIEETLILQPHNAPTFRAGGFRFHWYHGSSSRSTSRAS